MANTKVVLFKSKVLSNGEHPVLIRVTKDRKIKYLPTGFNCSLEFWDAKNERFKKRYPNQSKRNLILAQLKQRVLKFIDQFTSEGTDFTFKELEEQYKGKKSSRNLTIYEFFEEKIENLKISQKAGNAKVYSETCKSFFAFTNDKKLQFKDLNYRLLEKYEAHLRSRGGTGGGISLRMRTLRALYNDAIKKGDADQAYYPFKNYDISKLKSTGIKRALTREEVKRIEQFDVKKHPQLAHSRHYFVFSYYTRGMNFVDMMKLRWEDIQDEKISYIRSKTGKLFVLKVVPPVQEILDYFKSYPSNTNYVFPILLRENMTAQQIENRKKKTLKKYNKDLKEIASIAGIKKPVSSYVARHSYATNLKYAGVSTTIISEALGHKNQEVTENYLKAFENEVVDQATEILLDL